jgi:hypothetical protein
MIKEALEYIVGLNKAEVINVNGEMYTDKRLSRITPYVRRTSKPIKMDTLTSFVDYIKAQVIRDKLYEYKRLYIHITSPTSVEAFETDNPVDGEKTYIGYANALLPDIRYDEYYDSENFNILLQSRFCQSDVTRQLLSIVGNVKTSDVQTKSDNGITQTVHTNKGVVLQEDTILPNPVVLAPFRTFVEISQVSSAFIFRAKESSNPFENDTKEIKFALFEADGGAWKIEACKRIKTYLEDAFKDTDVVILA